MASITQRLSGAAKNPVLNMVTGNVPGIALATAQGVGRNLKTASQMKPSGGGGSARPDPFASVRAGFNTQKSNIYGSSREAASNSAIGYKGSILDFIDSLRAGQRGVDERGVQNELAKKQGFNNVVGMVGRGLQSGGVQLANKNASDSSAAEGLARAYGDIGQRELNTQGNQYEQENRQIGLAQEDLGRQTATGLRKLGDSKMSIVNNIVSQARGSLAQLDAAMAQASLPDRVSIEQEKENIKNEVLGILSEFDSMLASETGSIKPTSVDDRRRTAFGLANAGVAAENPFDFNTEVPAQFQGTGGFSAGLPVFTQPRRREV